jgi:hypothetical protein
MWKSVWRRPQRYEVVDDTWTGERGLLSASSEILVGGMRLCLATAEIP